MKKPTYGLEATESFKPASRWSVASVAAVIIVLTVFAVLFVFGCWLLAWILHFAQALTPFLPWPPSTGVFP